MNTILRIALLTALFLYFGGIFYLLKKRLLELRYTLLWIFSGIVMMLIVIFPAAFERLVCGRVVFAAGDFGFHDVGAVQNEPSDQNTGAKVCGI